jgi:anti-sigma B factor antagonist
LTTHIDFRVSTVKLSRRAYTVAVAGDVDLSTGTDLQEELASLPDDVSRVLVDLSGVTFLDSTGLGVLARFAKRLRARGGGVILVAGGPVRALLSMAALDGLFEIRDAGEEPARYLVGLSLLDSFGDVPLTGDARGLGA